MTDSKTITSAGQLLSEMQAMAQVFSRQTLVAEGVQEHFTVSDRVPWHVGLLRYNQLIDRVILDLEILPLERQEKYRQTLEKYCRGIVSLTGMSTDARASVETHFNELTFERIENFHDSLMISGRSFSLEKSRVDAAIQALSALIDEISAEPSEIDVFVSEKLSDLLNVLSRYDLFGAEGVRDYVNALIGAVATSIMEIRGPVPDQVKERLAKIVGVAKGTMDAFVYLATGAQGIEWANAHVLSLTAPIG